MFLSTNRSVKAKVEFIDPRVDPETHGVRFRTSIPNPDHRLKAGMFVRLVLETNRPRDRIDRPRTSSEKPRTASTDDRLNELERKLDRLLGDKDERSSNAKLLERLDALEHRVNQLLDKRRGE